LHCFISIPGFLLRLFHRAELGIHHGYRHEENEDAPAHPEGGDGNPKKTQQGLTGNQNDTQDQHYG